MSKKKEEEPVMGFHIVGGYGLYVYDYSYGIDDSVKFRYLDDRSRPRSRFSQAKVRYTQKGRAYFVSQGRRFYLDESDFVKGRYG